METNYFVINVANAYLSKTFKQFTNLAQYIANIPADEILDDYTKYYLHFKELRDNTMKMWYIKISINRFTYLKIIYNFETK